ncbi:hypothetical protein GCM10027048_39880 [Hymenobacter coalescens]
MKKILFALWLGVAAVSMTSCKDEDKDPLPKFEEVPLVLSALTTATYTQADARSTTANPVISLTTNVTGPNLDKVESVEIYKSLRNIVRNAQGQLALQTLPRVLVRTIPPAPTTTEISFNDLVANMQRRGPSSGSAFDAPLAPLTRASLTAQESFVFTYELVMKDGRRVVLTPTSGGIVSGTQAAAPYAGIVTIVQ